jgi:dinuclear metal center YbgI/SA1388 family protein
MEKLAPPQLAEGWDNVGLIIGNLDKKIDRVMLCLDITSEVVKEAVKKNIDLLVSHHPFIFSGLKSINTSNPQGRAIRDLIRNDINVYAAHTNYDSAAKGINQQLAELLGLSKITILQQPSNASEKNIEGHGLGRVGVLDPVKDMKEFICLVKKMLQANNVRVIGWVNKPIERVAVFCGSYDSNILDTVLREADILITGDIKYHDALDIVENNFCVIDAGHYYTEKIMIHNTTKILAKQFPDVEVESNNLDLDPYMYY